jgi:hypothetical protein
LRKHHSLIFLSPPRERIEVRGSFDKLRMTFLFAMVSLSNHHPHPDPLPSRERESEVMFPIGGPGRIS